MAKCIFCGNNTKEKHYDESCCNTCYEREEERLNYYELLAEAGVPFMDGEPVGI